MNIHLKTALDHIRRSPFQAIAAVFVLMVTFFVSTLLAVLVYSSNNLLKYFEGRPQVIAFLKDGVKEEDVSILKTRLESDLRVKDVVYVSKEQALEIYKKATSDNPLLSELVSPSIFPASIEFSLSELTFAQNVIDEVKKEDVVDQVGFTASLGGEDSLNDVVKRLKDVSMYIKVGGGVFVLFLISTSFLVLLVIISMRMTTRRGEIEILNLIGATAGFIRSPILLESLVYGLTGAFLGWIFGFIFILYAAPSVITYFAEIPILPKDTLQLFGIFGIILAAELVLSSFIAILGGYIAVKRARRKR